MWPEQDLWKDSDGLLPKCDLAEDNLPSSLRSFFSSDKVKVVLSEERSFWEKEPPSGGDAVRDSKPTQDWKAAQLLATLQVEVE